jgi:uncharacterized OB-fold protein
MTASLGAARYPMPKVDELTQPFWDGVNAHTLVIQRCNACGHYVHWPAYVCPRCLADDLGFTPVSGRGVVYSFSVTTHAFHPGLAATLPYTLVIVDLVEQERLRMVSQLVDCAEDDLAIGMPVEVTFERVAPELVLPFFRPAAQP